MTEKNNVYRRIIKTALAMPVYEPPTHEPVKMPKFERVREMLTRPLRTKEDVESVYRLLVNTAKTRTTLSKRVPVSRLHQEMAKHVAHFTIEAITRGGLPLKVFCFDRFRTVLDFGGGRCLTLSVLIDERPKQQSLASFVVEETSEEDFEKLDLIFDQVEPINRKEPTIQSAVIWQNEKPKTNGKGNQK